jgi:hypothetical protein
MLVSCPENRIRSLCSCRNPPRRSAPRASSAGAEPPWQPDRRELVRRGRGERSGLELRGQAAQLAAFRAAEAGTAPDQFEQPAAVGRSQAAEMPPREQREFGDHEKPQERELSGEAA